MNKREAVVSGVVLSLVALSLSISVLYPAMAVSQRRPPKATIPGHGSIRAVGLGVYWDSACTKSVSVIDWGAVERVSTVNRTVYVRNQGNSAVVVGLSVLNWSPTNAPGYFSVVWDYTGQTLAVGEVVPVVFRLSVSEGVQGVTEFSFDTVLEAV